MDEGNSKGWLVIAGACALWSLWAAIVGAGVAAPLLIGAVALTAGVSSGARRWLMDKLTWLCSGSAIRFTLVMIGVMMLWQIVGLELALFAAGDVLAYVEVLTAVSLMSAQARLAPVRTAVARRLKRLARPLRRSSLRARARRARPASPPTTDAEDDARALGGWAFA